MTKRKTWVSDFGDLTGIETDRALAMIGGDLESLQTHPMSMLCAVAVVIAQRTDPDIADEAWKSLKLSDLDIRSQINLDKIDKDPTRAG